MARPAASPGTSVRCPSGVRRTATGRGGAVPPSSPSTCRQKESKTGKRATFFLDSAFSADAYFCHFLPSSAQLNTLFKTRTSGQASIFIPLTQKRSCEPLRIVVPTRFHFRTDASARKKVSVLSVSFTCFHFQTEGGTHFPSVIRTLLCTFQHHPVRKNALPQKEKKGRMRKGRQRAFRESPEKALAGHQLVFGRKEGPSHAIHLTF